MSKVAVVTKRQTVFHREACNMGECRHVFGCPGCKRYVGRCMRNFEPRDGEETSLCLECYGTPRER